MTDPEYTDLVETVLRRAGELFNNAPNDQATKRNNLLEAILNELKAIRQDQVIIKEALLYAPNGPGAERARESFEAQQK